MAYNPFGSDFKPEKEESWSITNPFAAMGEEPSKSKPDPKPKPSSEVRKAPREKTRKAPGILGFFSNFLLILNSNSTSPTRGIWL